MKRCLVIMLLVPGAASAQGLVLGGSVPPPAPPGCVTAATGKSSAYGCINDQQRALVAQHQAGLAAAQPGPNSAAPRLGLYNQAATREQFGTAFGKSTVPQRPPPVTYTSPLIPH